MALPWYIPLEAAPKRKEKQNPHQQTIMQHYCNLNIHEGPCEELQTGLMCEIGTNNRDPGVIQRLIAAGMTVARLNMRDLDPDACAQLIQAIRKAVYNYSAELEYVYPLALIVDVRGPAIVTGDLKSGPKSTLEILPLEMIRLTTDTAWKESGTVDCLYVGYDQLTDLQKGDVIYIDSLTPGKVKLVVAETGDDSVECKVENGGTIACKMTVRISQHPKELSSGKAMGDSRDSICSNSSEQPFERLDDQIAWAVSADIDGVLVPDTQSANDIRSVRDVLSDKGKHLLIFACLDTVRALDNVDAIIAEADGVYVDRSVLSTDLPVEKIFIAQKQVLAKCRESGKPCIFQAVINEQIPTLCVTDIANLVIDGADVLGLELHYGGVKKVTPNYDAIRTAEHCIGAASVICRHAESVAWQPRVYANADLMASPIEDPTRAVCISAVELSGRARATAIICLTNSGRTAKILSHVKPSCPVVAVTRACHTARQLRFWRGVRAVHYFEVAKDSWAAEVESRVHAALDYCKAKRILRAGDPYVVVTGSRKGVGYCDAVRLLYASARDCVVVE